MMLEIKTALKGLRAAAPTVPSAAIRGLKELRHDLSDTVLSDIDCAAIVFGQLAFCPQPEAAGQPDLWRADGQYPAR